MSDLQSRIAEVLAPTIAYSNALEIVSSDGVWVTDAAGKRYLDFAVGIATTNLGHQHPGVKHAVLEQLDRLWHAGGSFRYESLVRAAERLRDVTPSGIEQFLFMNSGAEAVEAAVKLARKTTGRQGVVVFRGGFHGRTMGSVTYTTSKAKYRAGYHPLVGSVFVAPFPHPYRWGMTQDDADELALRELELLLFHEVTPSEVACFLVEPMQGEGGYYPASPRFLATLRELADEHGILLIADEVQTGFGRTGDWFATQVLDVEPDVLVMGKAIANGFPISAVGASKERFAQWPPGSHGTTFGGNPIAAAACAATVDGLAEIIEDVPKLADHAFTRLGDLQESHRTVGDVRGLGLMIGVELVGEDRTPAPEAFAAIRRHGLERGLIILDCGPHGNVVRFIPPLTVSLEQIDTAIEILDEALSSYEA